MNDSLSINGFPGKVFSPCCINISPNRWKKAVHNKLVKLGFEQKFELVKILTNSIFTKYVANKSAKHILSTKELPRKQFSCTWCGYFNKEFMQRLWNWFSKKFQMRFTRIFTHYFLGINNDGIFCHEQGSRSLILFYCDMHFFHLCFPQKRYISSAHQFKKVGI